MSSKRAQAEKRVSSIVKDVFDIMRKSSLDTLEEKQIQEAVREIAMTNEDLSKRIPASIKFCMEMEIKFQEEFEEYDNLLQVLAEKCASIVTPFIGGLRLSDTGAGLAFAIWAADIIVREEKTEELQEILTGDYEYQGRSIYDCAHDQSLLEEIEYIVLKGDRSEKNRFLKILELIPEDEIKMVKGYFLTKLEKLTRIFLKEKCSNTKLVEKTFIEEDREIEEDRGENSLMRTFVELDIKTGKFGYFTHEKAKDLFGLWASDGIEKFHIENPYMICAAFCIYRNLNSYLYWSFGLSTALYENACGRLPWNGKIDKSVDQLKVLNDPEIYRMKYDAESFMKKGDENEDVGPNKEGEKVNASQIIYHLSGGVIPPRRVQNLGEIKRILVNQGASSDEINNIILQAQLLREAARINTDVEDESYFGDEDDDEIFKTISGNILKSLKQDIEENEKAEQENGALSVSGDTVQESNEPQKISEEEINGLKNENKRLISQIHSLEQQLKKVRSEADEVKRTLARDKQELTDLRNFAYNVQYFNEEENEDDSTIHKFPYVARRNIVVFGGHDTWNKIIRPLFEKVKFISREVRPNKDMIKNSDVVWIQANAMAHKDYYAIIDIARTNNIPVRYFSYASARKCAEQLVEYDLRRD
mgnify:CR=1 FL=1